MAPIMPNPIAQRLQLLFSAAHPHPAGPGGVGQVAAGLDPAHRPVQAAAGLDPASRVGPVAAGLGVAGADAGAGGGLRSMLATALSGHHGHGGGLAEQFMAQHNPARMAEEVAAALGQDPGTHFGPDGGPSRYPGTSPIADIAHPFRAPAGPLRGSRDIMYSEPIRRRPALSQALQLFQQPPTHTYQAA
jgi:hypothetical protein